MLMTPAEIQQELGRRVQALRLAQNITQQTGSVPWASMTRSTLSNHTMDLA